MTAAPQRLVREVFTTSRLLDFCSERELVVQTGHRAERWPLVAVKELVDNGLDIAEEAEVAPQIAVSVSTQTGEITVSDNGPGITTETIDSLLDFTARTSSRAAYVGPSRGQQGHALQTILAMPFVLDGGVGETVIEARGIAHCVRFTVDPIRQEPRIACDRGSSSVKNGTRVTIRWPRKASHPLDDAVADFLPLLWSVVATNPHATIRFDLDDETLIDWNESSTAVWTKWRPSDPLPAHWFTLERLQRLIAAHVARDREHGAVRSVRSFIAETFHGLTGTAKLAAILKETDLARARLDAFFDGDRVDQAGIARLLMAMQRHSRTVKPEALGLIGEDHLRKIFDVEAAHQEKFRYKRVLGTDRAGLPYVIEAAFAPTAEVSSTPRITGVNFSAAIGDPFSRLDGYRSLDGVLRGQHVFTESSAVTFVHLAAPVVPFTDRGKTAIVVAPVITKALIDTVRKVTADWHAEHEAENRAHSRRQRAAEREEKAEVKAERAEEKRRKRNEIVGTGRLHRVITEAAMRSGLSLKALTVLSSSNDPFRRDTVEGHRNGRWFREQWERLVGPTGRLHLRGFFYRLVASADVERPNGTPFVNDLACWLWLQDEAARDARWLEDPETSQPYLPFERIVDQRNEAPRVIAYYNDPHPGFGEIGVEPVADLPALRELLPRVVAAPPVQKQPYRIIFTGEKSSLADVLEPAAREVKGELILGSGEKSATQTAEAVRRAVLDGRRAIVLVYADFDPSGWQMLTSIARKIQALRVQLSLDDLACDIYRVALTIEQVREFNLPSTPLKESEKRASAWVHRWGHEQTEIDALAALRPDLLEQITRKWLTAFFDFDLDTRCSAAMSAWVKEAQTRLEHHSDRLDAENAIEQAYEGVVAAVAVLERAQENAVAMLTEGEGAIGMTRIEPPVPNIKATPPSPPIFTTDDDFVTATRKLIADKALDDTPDED